MGYFSIKELGLPENSWAAFETHYPSVSFPPGRMIYLQGSSADRFYYLKAGRVKVFLNSEDGSEKILTVYEAGNVFGEASFFDELPRVSSAITVTCCEIVIIDRLTLEAEMQRNPQILLTITRVLARTVRMLSDHVDTMAFLRADRAHRPLSALCAGGRGTRHPLHPRGDRCRCQRQPSHRQPRVESVRPVWPVADRLWQPAHPGCQRAGAVRPTGVRNVSWGCVLRENPL